MPINKVNRRNLSLTGQVPTYEGRGTVNGEPPAPQASLRALHRRGVDGRDKNFQRQDVLLTSARREDGSGTSAPVSLGLSGNVLVVMGSTYSTDTAEVQFDGRGPWVPIGPGASIYGQPFRSVRLKNAAQIGSTMTLIGATDFPGDRLLFRYR